MWDGLMCSKFFYTFSLSEEPKMKKIAFIALALASGMAFATQPVKSCYECPEIDVNASLTQITLVKHSTVKNTADGGGKATQNLSSNMGNVTIDKATEQVTALEKSHVSNTASGKDAIATQSLASNIGNVDVNGYLTQLVAAKGSHIVNKASSYSKAIQNVSSNNGCEGCK
jgi:hypothetical protein